MGKSPVTTRNPYKTMFRGTSSKKKDGMHRPEGAGNFDNMDDDVISDLPRRPHAQTQPTRVLDTVYQNTKGHAIIVYGSILFKNDNVNENTYTEMRTDSSNPPTTVRQRIGFDNQKTMGETADIITWEKMGFFMIVVDDDYYTIATTTSGTGTITLQYWNEVDF